MKQNLHDLMFNTAMGPGGSLLKHPQINEESFDDSSIGRKERELTNAIRPRYNQGDPIL